MKKSTRKLFWILLTVFICLFQVNLLASDTSNKNHSGVYQVDVFAIKDINKNKLFSGFIKINQTGPGAVVNFSWAEGSDDGIVAGNEIHIEKPGTEVTLTFSPGDKAINGAWINDGKEGIMTGEKVDPSLWPKKGNINGKMLHIKPDPQQSFYWAYLLFIPEHLKGLAKQVPMLVCPNNSGIASDDLDVHKERAESRLRELISKSGQEKFPFTVLMPIFPRFENKMGGEKYYTHGLDRDTMLNRPEKQVAVTMKWQGELMSKNSKMTYNLDNLFMVQNNEIYRSTAADFNTSVPITGVSEFEVTFIFESGSDLHKPFNLIEFPRRGGFFFRDVTLTEPGKIGNSSDIHGENLKIIKLSLANDEDYQDLWNQQGEQYLIDEKKPIRHLDEQLIAMITDAKKTVLKSHNIKSMDKILMLGYSASGMFVDRFSYLHPDLIAAAAIGAPGGLPMIPLVMKDDSPLRYPIGLYDYQTLTGKSFDKEAFSKVHRFVFIGENDRNDSVTHPGRDSFEIEDEKLILEHFGKTPVERFRKIEHIFKENHLDKTQFVIYPGVGHMLNQTMLNDSVLFFYKWI